MRTTPMDVTAARCAKAARRPVVLALLLLAAPVAAAQHAVQTGRMLDRNPQLGSGGLNAERPFSPLLSGNAIVGGDVGRGMSFRGVGGISSYNTIRAPLGSSALSEFRRDSVSIGDAALPLGGLAPRLYFDPSRTAFTPRFLGVQQPPAQALLGSSARGQGSPGGISDPALTGLGPIGTSGVRPGASSSDFNSLAGPSPFTQDRTPTIPRLPVGSPYRPGYGLGPYATPNAPTDIPDAGASALRSQITGISPGPSADPRTSPLGTSPRIDRDVTPGPVAGGAIPLSPGARLLAPAPPAAEPVDSRLGAPTARLGDDPRPQDSNAELSTHRGPLSNPLDLVIRGSDSTTLLSRRDPLRLDGMAVRLEGTTDLRMAPELVPQRGDVEPLRAPTAARTFAALLPGQDVFTDLQMAVSLAQNPNAPWFEQIRDSLAASMTDRSQAAEMADLSAQEFSTAVLDAPITSFAGRGRTPLNETLAQAESLLDSHRYIDAASLYDQARSLDPTNPLPIIGKGHAQLAAGEYQSAATSILSGLQRFPEFSRLKVDLTEFLGNEAIDIRRSDLMRRLATQETPELRFLLGYIEYHAGLRDSGLQNMAKAADQAAPGSFIKRLPDMITGKGPLPPPRLPSSSANDVAAPSNAVKPSPRSGLLGRPPTDRPPNP